MAKHTLPRPTDAELAILNVLWRRGPSTVRQVFEELEAERGTGYTTALKILQNMFEKELVVRDDSARTHIYEAALSQEEAQHQLVNDLLDKAFDGSAQQLILHALSAKKASPQELAQIRQMLRRMERGDK